MKDLIRFLKNPTYYDNHVVESKHNVLKIILLLLLLDLVIGLLTVYPVDRITEYFQISKTGFSILGSYDRLNTRVGRLIEIILIIPIMEELMVRLYLRNSLRNILLSIISNTVYICFISFHDVRSAIIAIAIISLFFVAVFSLPKGRSILIKSKSIWEKNFPIVFYSSVILFAFYHAIHYSTEGIFGYLAIAMLVIPKGISGCFIGYIRIKHGFIWGTLLHTLMNSIAAVFILMSLS